MSAHRTRRVLALALVLSASPALPGCFGSSPEPRYFALVGATSGPTVAAPAIEPWPVHLVVARFATPAVYERSELVYRPAARELRFDAYRLWVAKPSRMLSEAVAEHLRGSGLFLSVVDRASGSPAELELRGTVLAIEELDVDATHWQASLAIRFELVRLADEQVVWRHAFATVRDVPSRATGDVVATLDAILGDELARLDVGLDAHLGAAAHEAPRLGRPTPSPIGRSR